MSYVYRLHDDDAASSEVRNPSQKARKIEFRRNKETVMAEI